MSNSMFKRAERRRVHLKIGLMGASGSGKSRSALELAKGLAAGGPVAAIDTENGSLSLYSHVAEFDVADLSHPFDPQKYIEIIQGAEEAGYKVLIIDSFSHAWKYLLEKKEGLDRRGGSNKYTNWGPVKAEADRLKDAILQSRLHVVCCMRAKTEYAQENGKVTKLGMAAIQEPDAEYEFTTVFQIDAAHNASQSKDRTGLFQDRIFRIDANTGKAFLNWLDSAESQAYVAPPPSDGEAAQKPAQAPQTVPASAEADEKVRDAGIFFRRTIGGNAAQFAEFKAACEENQWSTVALDAERQGVESFAALMRFAKEGGAPTTAPDPKPASPAPSAAPSAASVRGGAAGPANASASPTSDLSPEAERFRRFVFAATAEKGVEYVGDGKTAVLAFLSESRFAPEGGYSSSRQLDALAWEERAQALRRWVQESEAVPALDAYLAQQGSLAV